MARQDQQSGNNQQGKGGQNQGGNQGGNQGDRSSERGFASMDDDKQRAIAAEGGRAAHESGNAHEFTSEEAREAGRKGGQASGGGNRSGADSDRDMQASGSQSQGGGNRGGNNQDQERDEQGQFTSEDRGGGRNS